MRIGWRRVDRDDRGAAAVEFALISIPLMVIVLAIINFGFAFYWQTTLSEVSREAARYASIDCPGDANCISNMQKNIINKNSTGLDLSKMTLAYSLDGNANQTCSTTSTASNQFQVTLTYAAPIGGIFSVNLKGVATTPCGG